MPESNPTIHFDTYRPSCEAEVVFLPEFPVRKIIEDSIRGVYGQISEISPKGVIIFRFIYREFPHDFFQIHYVLNLKDERFLGTYYIVSQPRENQARFSPIILQVVIDYVLIPEILEITGKPAQTDMDLADVSLSN